MCRNARLWTRDLSYAGSGVLHCRDPVDPGVVGSTGLRACAWCPGCPVPGDSGGAPSTKDRPCERFGALSGGGTEGIPGISILGPLSKGPFLSGEVSRVGLTTSVAGVAVAGGTVVLGVTELRVSALTWTRLGSRLLRLSHVRKSVWWLGACVSTADASPNYNTEALPRRVSTQMSS